MRRITSVGILLAIILATVWAVRPTAGATLALNPASYTTTSGAAGGQPVSALGTRDQSGTQNDWNKYVEFGPSGGAAYAGYRTYVAPAGTTPGSLSGLQVQANFLGPSPAEQTWTWQIYNWTGATWAALGTNAGASWDGWKLLTFNATGTLANYLNPASREIRIRLVANNTSDSADLDYEAVSLITNTTATATPIAPTATPIAPTATSIAPTATRTATPIAPTATPIAPTATATATPIAPTATPTVVVGGTTFYVATNGSDSNPGTQAAPWRTIQKAANSATPGSRVLIRGGTYSERVSINVSGSAAAGFTTFQSYPGERAAIDGASLPSTSGENALVIIRGRSYIVVRDLELRNLRTSSSGVVPIGISVAGASASIELRNNFIHHIETNYTGLNGGDAHGIAVYGDSSTAISRLVVDGNELANLKLGSSEALVINGNVDGFSVTNNLVHDVNNIAIDAIGYEGVAPSNDRARNGLIAGNRVWKVDTSTNPAYGATCGSNGCSGGETSAGGIYVDGGTQITIERNLVVDSNLGIELASEHAGKSTDYITVRNNVIANVDYAGIALGGYSASSSGSGGGNARFNTVVNNTVYTPAKGAALLAQYRVSDNTIANNILAARSGEQRVIDDAASFLRNTEAGNLLKTATTASPNPGSLFVSVARPSDADLLAGGTAAVRAFLHINAGSEAHNRGASAAAGDRDIDGEARVAQGTIDVGADEIQ